MNDAIADAKSTSVPIGLEMRGQEPHLGFGFAGPKDVVGKHVSAGQEDEIIGAAGAQQCEGELHRVLEIDVVVGYPMYDEQGTLQTGGIGKHV